MDNFAEYLVKKQPTASEKIKNIFIISVCIILTIAFFLLGVILRDIIISFILLILAVAMGFLSFFFIRNTKVEYEYTFTNGDLDIDKIIAQSKRKEMLSVSVAKFTDFGRYDDNAPEEKDDMVIVLATDNIASHEWYADFQHENYGNCRLIFCPDEKMLSNIVKFLHPSLRSKCNRSLQENYINELDEEN